MEAVDGVCAMNFTAHYSSSAGNLYSIVEGERRLLMDPGVPIKKIREALNHGLSEYPAALLSHSHDDHAHSAKEIMKAGIDLFCSPQTAKSLRLNGHRLNVLNPDQVFWAGGFKAVAFSTNHDCPGSLGFFVMSPTSKLVFITDSYFVRYRFQGLTHIAIECNWSKDTLSPDLNPAVKRRLLTSHFSLEHVKEFIRANMSPALREVHLLHMSRENSDVEVFTAEIQKLIGKPVYVGER